MMLLQKITWTDYELDDLPKLVRPLFENPNEPFPNWRFITSEQFAQADFWTYSPFAIINKTIVEGKRGYINYLCFLFPDGTGYGISHNYWEKTIQYVAFGCDHNMKLVENLGRCYNRYTCSKCGFTQDIDSSD